MYIRFPVFDTFLLTPISGMACSNSTTPKHTEPLYRIWCSIRMNTMSPASSSNKLHGRLIQIPLELLIAYWACLSERDGYWHGCLPHLALDTTWLMDFTTLILFLPSFILHFRSRPLLPLTFTHSSSSSTPSATLQHFALLSALSINLSSLRSFHVS